MNHSMFFKSKAPHILYINTCHNCPAKEVFTNNNTDFSNGETMTLARQIQTRQYKNIVVPIKPIIITPPRNKF